MKHELTFKPQARIIRTLGDRLISGEVAAIVELVKNSYDADAISCYIKFDPENDKLIILDDGHGMSLKDIEEKWIQLGTDNKSHGNKMSKSGRRRFLGSKGIGRLATAKLGRNLRIESTTRQNGEAKTIVVDGLDWDKFLPENNEYLQDVKFYAEETVGGEKPGTTLTISNLSQQWDENKLIDLAKELRKLISPLTKDDNEFKIFLDLDLFTSKDHGFDGGEIINAENAILAKIKGKDIEDRNRITPFPVLGACDYTFEAEYSKNEISGILRINDEGIEHEVRANLERDINLGNGLVQLYIFDRDTDSLRSTFSKIGMTGKRNRERISLKDARRYLDDLSGIAVYRNQFRIRPYGDKEADWLGLNKRRVQNPSKCLEQAQISGLVVVDSPEDSGLIERSSREGLEHNDHFFALRDLLLKALHEVEVLRLAHKDRIGKNRRQDSDVSKSNISLLMRHAELKSIKGFSKHIAESKKQEFDEALEKHKTSLEKLIAVIQERQSVIEGRSALGLIFADVIHEASHPASAIGTDLRLLKGSIKNQWQKEISPTVHAHLLEQIEGWIGQIDRWEAVLDRLRPLIKITSKKPQEFSVYRAVERSLLVYAARAKADGVQIEHVKPENEHRIIGQEVDISTAIINLIDNALYWHKARKIDDPWIKISYEEDAKKVAIFVDDNAGGVSNKYQDAIFNVGFTAKEGGLGLGLNIARESLGRAGAFIHHEHLPPAGSRFVIEIWREI